MCENHLMFPEPLFHCHIKTSGKREKIPLMEKHGHSGWHVVRYPRFLGTQHWVLTIPNITMASIHPSYSDVPISLEQGTCGLRPDDLFQLLRSPIINAPDKLKPPHPHPTCFLHRLQLFSPSSLRRLCVEGALILTINHIWDFFLTTWFHQ